MNISKKVLISIRGRLEPSFCRYKRLVRPVALAFALVLFCTGLILSLRSAPDVFGQVRFFPLLVIFLITLPLGVMINAFDFQLLAQLSKTRVSFRRAVEVTIYTRAANMLPIPGSIAVRIAVLKGQGVEFKTGGGLMLLFTMLWGGMGFCFSAAWLFGYESYLLAAALGGTGLTILTGCIIASLNARLDMKKVGSVAILRFFLIAIEALTLMLAFRALGLEADYSQTAIMVVASFIASIVPAGIGVRESLIAVLAPLAGVDPALGFLAGVAMRVTGMTFLAACSVGAFWVSSAMPGNRDIELAKSLPNVPRS